MTAYSPLRFALFRIVLGAFLCTQYTLLIPWAGELFGSANPAIAIRPSFVRSLFPNLLDRWTSPAFATDFVTALAVVAALFAAGIGRRTAGVLLWYGLTCLTSRNHQVLNPAHAYLGWLCLACAIVPTGEPLRVGRVRDDWTLPRGLFAGAWWVMALSYTASGLAKLKSPEWVDGTALGYVLDLPETRDWWMRTFLLSQPWISALITWAILAVEFLFAPLCVFRAGRKWAWFGTAAMHLGILVMCDFRELTAGMLIMHLFTFDPRWTVRSASP